MNGILALALWATGITTVLVVGARLMEDAEQRRAGARDRAAHWPDGLDLDGLPLLDAAELLMVRTPDDVIWERS